MTLDQGSCKPSAHINLLEYVISLPVDVIKIIFGTMKHKSDHQTTKWINKVFHIKKTMRQKMQKVELGVCITTWEAAPEAS